MVAAAVGGAVIGGAAAALASQAVVPEPEPEVAAPPVCVAVIFVERKTDIVDC